MAGSVPQVVLRLLMALGLTVTLSTASAPQVEAAPAPTTTSLSVSPNGGDSTTVLNLSSTVFPNPGLGLVRLMLWTAQSGGELVWDQLLNVNINGVARLAGGLTLDPGTHWWQAEFLGNATFAGSASNRKSVSISGVKPSITNVSINWGQTTVQYGATVGPLQTSGGALDLIVDNEVHASCRVFSAGTVNCSTSIDVTSGDHRVALKFVPKHGEYGTATSSWRTYPGPGMLPPISGIAVAEGRVATRTLDVIIEPAGNDVGQTVTRVRLANSSAVDGAGDLSQGQEFDYAVGLPWRLANGVDGPRTVWAQLKRADGTWSTVVSDSIVVDTAAPQGSFVINADDATIGDPWCNCFDDQVITGTVSDVAPNSSGAITHVALSNDGLHFRVEAFPGTTSGAFETDWNFYGAWGSSALVPGVKTVYAKWRDAAGNWSNLATDTIEYVDNDTVGTVLVDGELTNSPDPAYRHSTTVTLTFQIRYVPPEGIDFLRVGNELEEGTVVIQDWPNPVNEMSIPWSLTNPDAGYTATDGVKNINVDLVTNNGRHAAFGARVILDRVVPTSNVPVPGFALNETVSEQAPGFAAGGRANVTAIPTEIQWRGNDSVGIEEFDLDRLINGTWNDVELSSPTATSAVETVTTATANQFRLQATDLAGNTSPWKTGQAFSAYVRQENDPAIAYSGNWQTTARSDALGGALKSVKAQGAYVKLRFTGRAIAWVAPRSSGAVAAVKVDGTLIKNVFLSSASYQPRRIVFSMSWKTAGTHTIKIIKKYSSYTVPIDALIVLS